MKLPKRWQRSRQTPQPKDMKIRACSRGTIYGNPFEIGYHEYGGHSRWWTRHDVCALFGQELDVIICKLGMTEEEYFLPLLQFDYLSCWCKLDEECHVDIILERLERLTTYHQLSFIPYTNDSALVWS